MDDTLNVMSTFMDVICHADSRDDLGVYDAMNRGMSLSKRLCLVHGRGRPAS